MARKTTNISNKQRLRAARERIMQKRARKLVDQKMDDRASARRRKAIKNKQLHPTLTADEGQAIYDGISTAISAMRESVNPTSIFACVLTMLGNKDGTVDIKRTPYLMGILDACLPQLSRGVVIAKHTEVLEAARAALRSCHNIVAGAKTVKVLAHLAVFASTSLSGHALEKRIYDFLLSLRNEKLLAPNLFVDVPRKIFSALTEQRPSILLGSLPQIQALLCNVIENFAGSAITAKATSAELNEFATRCLKPAFEWSLFSTNPSLIAGCNFTTVPAPTDGAPCSPLQAFFNFIDAIAEKLTQVFRGTECRANWDSALDGVAHFFTAFHILKRAFFNGLSASGVDNENPYHLFNSTNNVTLLARIIGKIRAHDDTSLNNHCDRALVSIGNCVPLADFMQLIQFNPHNNNNNNNNDDEGAVRTMQEEEMYQDALWKNSFLPATVWSHLGHHEPMALYANVFLARIDDCIARMDQANKDSRPIEHQQWHLLHDQYWRCVSSFCDHGHIDVNSFRKVARRMVGVIRAPNLSGVISTALCSIINSCVSLSKEDDMDIDEDDLDDEDEDEDEDDENDNNQQQKGGSTMTKSQKKLIKKQQQQTTNKVQDSSLTDTSLHVDDVINPHLFHFTSRSEAQAACDIFTQFSGNIMPALCNAYENSPNTAILSAIRSYAKVCSPAVMSNILDGILKVAKNMAEGDVATWSDTRRLILDICGEIAPQLSEEHIAIVLQNIIQPVFTQGEKSANRRIQKKAYKLLYQLFEHRVAALRPHIDDILNALGSNLVNVRISAVKERVKCLSWALDACKMYRGAGALMELILAMTNEVVLCTRDRSSIARERAMELLEKMLRYTEAIGSGAISTSAAIPPSSSENNNNNNSNSDDSNIPARPTFAFMMRVASGLAGETTLLVAATIISLAKLFWLSWRTHMSREEAQRLLSIIFPMVSHTSNEVRSAACTFCRAVLNMAKNIPEIHDLLISDPLLPESVKEPVLDSLLHSIGVVISQKEVSSSVRMMMRRLIEKVVKRYDPSMVESHFPEGSRRFVHYVAKMMRRSDRLRTKQQEDIEKEKIMQEIGAGDTSTNDLAQRMVNSLSGKYIKKKANHSIEGESDEDAEDEDDEELRLIGMSVGKRRAAEQVKAIAAERAYANLSHHRKDHGEERLHLDIDKDSGRIRVMNAADFKADAADKARKAMATRLLEEAKSGGTAGPSLNPRDFSNHDRVLGTQKRMRVTDAVEDFENAEMIRLQGGGGEGAADLLTKNENDDKRKPSAVSMRLREQLVARREMKKQRLEQDVKSGEEFKAKKAGGDVKKGNVDPFAYIPLNRALLNKRNISKRKERFEAVDPKHIRAQRKETVTASLKAARAGKKRFKK